MVLALTHYFPLPTLKDMAFQLPQEFQKEVFELTLALYRVTDFFPKNDTLRRSLREKANEIFSRITEYGHGKGDESEALLIFARIESIKGYLDIARTMRLVKPVNLSVLYREYEFLGQFFKNESRLPPHLSPNTPPERWGGLSDIKNTPFPGDVGMSHRKDNEATQDTNHASHRKVSGGVKSSVDPIVDGANVSNFSGSVLNRSDAMKEKTEASRPARDGASNVNRTKTAQSPTERDDKGHIGHVAKPEGVSERQKAIIGHMKKADKKARLGNIHALFGDISSKTIQRDLFDLVSRNILRKEGEKRWTTYFLVDG